MDLLLWRHADAADGEPDAARPLTRRGESQAERMAQWLKQRLPAETRILVSPARRAQQTASALTAGFETCDAIAVGADAAALIEAAGWPDAKHAVLMVGHQPTLGEAAATLLGAPGRDVPVRKGAVLWLRSSRRKVRDTARLVAVMEPAMLEKGDVTPSSKGN